MTWGNQGKQGFTTDPFATFGNKDRSDSVFKGSILGGAYITIESKNDYNKMKPAR